MCSEASAGHKNDYGTPYECFPYECKVLARASACPVDRIAHFDDPGGDRTTRRRHADGRARGTNRGRGTAFAPDGLRWELAKCHGRVLVETGPRAVAFGRAR